MTIQGIHQPQISLARWWQRQASSDAVRFEVKVKIVLEKRELDQSTLRQKFKSTRKGTVEVLIQQDYESEKYCPQHLLQIKSIIKRSFT